MNIIKEIEEAFEESRIVNSYSNILLGETVECVITINGEELKQRKLGTVFTREKLQRLAQAHADNKVVEATVWNAPQALKTFIEQPLPADITPETVIAYYQSL